MDLCVLRLLTERGPLSGNDIADRVQPVADWARDSAPIFPRLHRLQDSGWISSDPEGTPPVYAITPGGRDAVARLSETEWAAAEARLQRLLGALRFIFGDRVGQLVEDESSGA